MATELRRLLPVILITAAILALALLATFTTPTKEYTMTPREGRATIVEFVQNTSRQLDLEGWWPRNGAAAPSHCSLSGDTKGAAYSFDLWVPRGPEENTDADRPAQREHYANLVADYWRSLGMKVKILSTAARYPTVYGSGGPVLRADFVTGATDNSYSIGTIAPCSPGNSHELLLEDNERYANGIRLPGDEGLLEQNDPRRAEKSQPHPRQTENNK